MKHQLACCAFGCIAGLQPLRNRAIQIFLNPGDFFTGVEQVIGVGLALWKIAASGRENGGFVLPLREFGWPLTLGDISHFAR